MFSCLWTLLNRGWEMPLAGHLLVHLVVRFAFGSPIELEHGVDADFPGSLLDGGLLFAEDDFALVFVAEETV
jgi:hypothetical protein